MADVPVEIWQIARDEDQRDMVLLRDAQGRVLPIVIGVCEAAAIWVVLSPTLAKPYVRRPWTHDLMLALLERFGARLDHVVIDGYTDGVFYATLHLLLHGEELLIDARPSDAIALLLRADVPLLVHDEVLQEAGLLPNETEDDGPDFDEGLR
ncbi:MAG TPA: bifunctional nuclease family protein [Armatimonadota bacterium]